MLVLVLTGIVARGIVDLIVGAGVGSVSTGVVGAVMFVLAVMLVLPL